MRVQCPNCGGDHPKWECKRPAKKSTAALKEVRLKGVQCGPKTSQLGVSRSGCALSPAEAGSLSPNQAELAGTQALPVDTKPRRGRPKMEAPTSARADYQREYVAKWRRGEVGNKYRQPLPKQYD